MIKGWIRKLIVWAMKEDVPNSAVELDVMAKELKGS